VLEMNPGEALFRPEGEVIYLVLSLRNVGTGIAHLRGNRLEPETEDSVRVDPLGPARHRPGGPVPDPATFADQQRDLYIAPGDTGFWQAALRDPHDPAFKDTEQAHRSGGRLTVDVLNYMAIWRMLNQQSPDWCCFPPQTTRPGAATPHTIGETSLEASSPWAGGRRDCGRYSTPGRFRGTRIRSGSAMRT